MNFIIDNYLWFGIAGVILLMALIGFLAEKTNFIVGSSDKPKKTKKKKKPTANEFMDTSDVVEEPVVEDTTYEDAAPVEEVTSEVTPEQNETASNDEVLDFSTLATATEPSIASAPLNVTDTWTQPDNAVDTPKEAAVITETGEDLTQPFGEPIKAPTEPVAEEQATTNAVDEDIWKF